MRIISEIASCINKDFALEQYWSSVFPLSDDVINYINTLVNDQPSVVLYSGSPRLLYNATYIEPTIFANIKDVSWHQKTLFIDPKNKTLINYTIKKLKPKNLLILNSNIFIRYRVWNEILHDIQAFKKVTERVIMSIPMNRFDFNRLKFSEHEIAKKLSGQIIDNTVIICQ